MPFVFVLMTRRRASDYSAVFDFLLKQLNLPMVQEIVSDFERAVFKEVKRHFPQVRHIGCSFHFAQAVVKKVRDIGLYQEFVRPGPIKTAIDHLILMPLLPATKIKGVFEHFKLTASNLKSLSPLINYVERNWVSGTCWVPEKWSFFNLQVRTNNDAEGKHRFWNNRGKGAKLPFYQLADHLYEITTDVPLVAELLTHEKITRRKKKTQDQKNSMIYRLWDDYNNQLR